MKEFLGPELNKVLIHGGKNMTFRTIHGKDSAGNNAYILVSKDNGKILIFSSEECGDVFFTRKQAKELVKAIEDCIKK